MALPEKFIRSKCPNCKKNGIEFWKTGTRYSPKLTCKYCKKTYKVSWAVSFLFTLVCACSMGGLLSLINNYVFKIPIWLCFVIILIPFMFFEYFAPLEEFEDGKNNNEIQEDDSMC